MKTDYELGYEVGQKQYMDGLDLPRMTNPEKVQYSEGVIAGFYDAKRRSGRG